MKAENRRGIIISGGELGFELDSVVKRERLRSFILGHSPILCADSGALYAYELDIKPDYILGDWDSGEVDVLDHFRYTGVELIPFPARKDRTDTEISVDFLLERGVKSMDIICALGGRLDHALANLMLLEKISDAGAQGRILSEREEILLIHNGSLDIYGAEGDWLSLISLDEESEGISLSGLDYPLSNARILRAQSLGISNMFTGERARVSVDRGTLLIVHTFSAPGGIWNGRALML